MRSRILGRTGLALPEIGFGCGSSAGLLIGGDPAARRAAIGRALERGIAFFDTAAVYGAGQSERNLGIALRELGATPLVASKVALETDDLDDIAGAVVRSVEGSLARLGIAALPLVHLHNRVGTERAATSGFGSGALLTLDDVLGPNGVLDGFARLQRRGLVRFVGCSAFGGSMTHVARLIDSGRFDSLIVNYSILNQTAFVDGGRVNPLFAYAGIGARAAAAGMGVIALRVLEAGALATGFARHPVAADPGSPDYAQHIAQAQTLRFLAADDAATLVTPAIRFALSRPEITSVLVGISDVAHVDEAADAAARGPLDASELTRIEALRAANFTR
jgi:aryl-alcohol dehydrogenase-like predicted oxidoreductase